MLETENLKGDHFIRAVCTITISASTYINTSVQLDQQNDILASTYRFLVESVQVDLAQLNDSNVLI